MKRMLRIIQTFPLLARRAEVIPTNLKFVSLTSSYRNSVTDAQPEFSRSARLRERCYRAVWARRG